MGRKKWALIGALLSLIVLSAVFVSESSQKPNFVEIPLGNALPAKYTDHAAPTSYWADPHHIVCCFQGTSFPLNGMNVLTVGQNIRRGMVYEYPSGRNWRLPALDSQNHNPAIGIYFYWDYIGLSKDHKRLFASVSGIWYTTSTFPIDTASKVLPPKWTQFAFNDSTQGGGIITFPAETSPQIEAKVPVIDRITGFPSYDSRSISPTGTRIAWLDTHLPSERFHQLREFLRAHHILSERPPYAIWVSDPNGRNSYCLATFGQPDMGRYDLRWSPDGKHISCFSITRVFSGPNEFRLTVFDVDH